MQKTNLKIITSLVLSGALLMSGVCGYTASAKVSNENSKVQASQREVSPYRLVDYKISHNDGGTQVTGKVKKSAMKGSSIESIIRANGDLLEIKNAESMDFEVEHYLLYGILHIYQVVDGYKVDTNSIMYQPKHSTNKDFDEMYLSSHFNNDIFNNLNVTKQQVRFGLERAIDVAKEKSKDHKSQVKAETVITKINNKYVKAHKVEIFDKGYYIDVNNGSILKTFSIYVGPL